MDWIKIATSGYPEDESNKIIFEVTHIRCSGEVFVYAFHFIGFN